MRLIFDQQQDYFKQGKTLSLEFRVKMLKKLKEMLKENEFEIYQALELDLSKSHHETLTTELGIIYNEIDFALKHLENWMKIESVSAPLTHQGTRNYIIPEPYGTVLVISPWNYPLQLALLPVVGAISAGNTVILKPSELASQTEKLLESLIGHYFDPQFFALVTGDKQLVQELLTYPFDYLFFTGSTAVGKEIMKQASENLIPLTLELGGKSPAIVSKTAHIKYTARRLVWGKFTNAGQTCVAPDYVLVEKSMRIPLIKAMIKEIEKQYTKTPLKNTDYVKIINEKHFDRLINLYDIDHAVHGGTYDRDTLKIEPTLLTNIDQDAELMQEEIFGPLLPIIIYDSFDEVIPFIRNFDKPLALYYFGKNEAEETSLLKNIRFGGGAINDTLYHLANPHLPFGGVGHSGLGSYHGKYSFDTFSHAKSIMEQTTKFDLPFRYPGKKIAEKIARIILK